MTSRTTSAPHQNINNTIQSYSILGTMFDIEFTFQDGYIDVYKFYQGLPNLLSTYETQLNISDIQCIQVWGDVMKITEVSFKYP